MSGLHGKADAMNRGVAVAVRGSVVDVRFGGHPPPINSVLDVVSGFEASAEPRKAPRRK